MTTTRRQSSLYLLSLFAVAPLLASRAALAARPQKPTTDDEDADNLPNVFISPCGEPFRAKPSAPYPIIDWFKKADANSDGKLDHAEFRADAEAFFKKLDRHSDGVLSHYDVLVYEHYIAPEILGGRVKASQADEPRLWLAQMPGGMGGGMGGPMGGASTSIDPGGDHQEPSSSNMHSPQLDESGTGAAPYSLFEEPEPIMTADFNVDGYIRKDNFMKVADMHFTALDRDNVGYLTLATLPRTPLEKLLHKYHSGTHKS